MVHWFIGFEKEQQKSEDNMRESKNISVVQLFIRVNII